MFLSTFGLGIYGTSSGSDIGVVGGSIRGCIGITTGINSGNSSNGVGIGDGGAIYVGSSCIDIGAGKRL